PIASLKPSRPLRSLSWSPATSRRNRRRSSRRRLPIDRRPGQLSVRLPSRRKSNNVTCSGSQLGVMSMSTRRLWGLALGLAVALVVGHWVGSGPMPEAAAQPAKGDAAPGKGKRAQQFIAAFEKGDAKAVASFWTENADYVDQTGREYKGRAAIQKMYEKFFAGKKGMKLNIIVLSARMVGTDVAIEDGITEVT